MPSSSAAVKKQRTHFRLPGPVLDFAKIVYKKYLKQIPTSKLSPTKMSRHLRDTFKTSSPTRILKKLFELIDVSEDEVSESESSEEPLRPTKDIEKKKPKAAATTTVSRASSAEKKRTSSSSSKSKPKKTERNHKTTKSRPYSSSSSSSSRRINNTADDDITLNAERSE